jgi:hypothetical protein
MGLFPFASTVGSMSNSSAVPANGIATCDSRDMRHSVRCWPPNGPQPPVRSVRSSLSSVRFTHSHTSASCFGTVQRHAARLCIGGAGGERGPP